MTDDIQLAPNKVLTTKSTDEDKIILYLQGELKRTELSKKLEEKLNRYQRCADLIKRYGSRLKVAPMMEKLFDISTAQAYRDFNATQQVFATTQQNTQAFWVDILMGQIMKNIKKAQKKGDYKAVASLVSTMQKTIKENIGSAEAIPYDKLVAPVVILGFWPETLNVDMPDDLEEQIKRFKKTKLNKLDAEDVDFEEA